MKHRNDKSVTFQLFDTIRGGDVGAFSRYYEDTMPWLVPYIRRLTNDIEEARNIAHDTFVKLWSQREQIDPRQSLDGFVSKIAANATLDLMRKKRSHSKYHGEQAFLQTDGDHAADASVLAAEMELLIETALRNMPPKRRKVFELSRQKKMTYDEIAAELGLSPHTVRNHMALALEDIRAMIALSVVALFLAPPIS